MDTKEVLKQIVRTIFSAMNTREFSGLEEVMAENIAFDFPGPGLMEGKKRVLIFLKALMRKYSALTFKVSNIIVEEQHACAIWTNEGTSIEGKPYQNSGVTLVHFEEGKIKFLSDYFKDTSFVK